MTNINKSIISEDLEFIREYVLNLAVEHDTMSHDEVDDIFRKIDRRIKDIRERLDA